MFTAISAKAIAWSASGLIALAAAAGATLAGDITVQAGGVEITVGQSSEQGIVMTIQGANCPGTSCQGLALNWDALKRG